MNRSIGVIAIVVCGLSAVLVTAQDPESVPGLEVHEWGTFTSMQGSDGIVLEGLHHEEGPCLRSSTRCGLSLTFLPG